MGESIFEEAERLGYISKGGDIIKCPYCGNSEIGDQPTVLEGSLICEADIYCMVCHTPLGYWAYGSTTSYDFITELIELGLVRSGVNE